MGGIQYGFFFYVPINICLPSVELWEPAEVKKKKKVISLPSDSSAVKETVKSR